jgi:outer membrane protein OmpA-like peptidoglycan-associated protein
MVLGDRVFTLRVTFATYRLRVHRLGAPPVDAGQAELSRQARLDLCVGIEWRDPEVLRVALGLDRALSGPALHDFGEFDRLSPRLFSEQQSESLARRLADALERGRISVERESSPSLTERRERFNPELPPRTPPPRESPFTFFDVRFVDEVGRAINGIPVEYQVDGGFRDVTTNAAGVALLEGVKDSTAKVSITEVEALEKMLDSRWKSRRLGSPPKEANTTKLVFQGAPVGPLDVKAVIPHTVILEPPRGRLFIELLDKAGRTPHAQRAYTISGPESFSGTTDDAGMLRHDDVFPGDYTLTLTLDFFEGNDKQTDTYRSPLVILPPGASAPDRRLIGAIPYCVLARLHFFFNTNKTFLLPTALPSLRALRKLYLQNSPCKLLVVGHADTSGGSAYNDRLSLDRAEATIAYLEDDVEGWFKFYGEGIEKKKRWGKAEDRLMIGALPDFDTKPEREDAVGWYQRTRELEVDGKAGPQTRRKLIAEYMSLDGASLLDLGIEMKATAHGCGEHFPLDDTGEVLDRAAADEKRDPVDRRVELFFFDTEFGIVPAPSGKNSKARSAEYPAWRKQVVQTVDLEAGELEGPKVSFVELADSLFRTDSAVVLPQGEHPTTDNEKHESLTSVSGFAMFLRFNEEHPGKRAFIAGHTDTRGNIDFNQKLSEERAQCALAVLMGDRQRFQGLCQARHTVADYKQILSWVARAFPAFKCDPGKIDDNLATANGPVRRFQEAYNSNKEALGIGPRPPISVDGSVGKETWGAFFDCYEAALQQELGEEPSGVAELRKALTFVDDRHPSLGFSEHFPIEELGVENYRSQANRRVELLLFDQGEEPDLEHAANDPETSELYLPGNYVRRPIPDRPGGAKAHVKVSVLLFRPAGTRSGIAYELSNEAGTLKAVLDESHASIEGESLRLEFFDVPRDSPLTLRQLSNGGTLVLMTRMALASVSATFEQKALVTELAPRAEPTVDFLSYDTDQALT